MRLAVRPDPAYHFDTAKPVRTAQDGGTRRAVALLGTINEPLEFVEH